MNYLRKKLQGLRMCADFKGYLREVTGAPPLTLTDCMGSDLVSLSVTGNAVQDGTPSAAVPVAVQGVGERTGNLFSLDGRTELRSTSASPPTTPKEFNNNIIVGLARNGYWDSTRIVSYSFDGDNFTLQSSAGYGLGFDFDVSEGETYTIKFDSSAAVDSGASFYDADGLFISVTNISTGGTVTAPAGATKLVWCVASKGSTGVTVSSVQVLKGSYTMPAYEAYGYKVPVKVCGINLFGTSDRAELESTYSSPPTAPKDFNNNIIVGLASNGYWDSTRIVSYTINDDSFTLQSSAGYGLGFDFDVKAGETYTVSYTATESRTGYAAWYDADGLYMSRTAISGAFASVTAPNGATKMVLCFDSSSVAITISDMQVLKGSYTVDTMPPYVPYHEPQEVNIYTDKPLYAVGGAGDTIELDFDAKTATRTDKTAEIKAYNNEPISGEYISSTGSLTEGAQVIYALSEPVTADISDLQNWDEVPSLWRGTAMVSAETAVQPSSMTAKYYATQKED